MPRTPRAAGHATPRGPTSSWACETINSRVFSPMIKPPSSARKWVPTDAAGCRRECVTSASAAQATFFKPGLPRPNHPGERGLMENILYGRHSVEAPALARSVSAAAFEGAAGQKQSVSDRPQGQPDRHPDLQKAIRPGLDRRCTSSAIEHVRVPHCSLCSPAACADHHHHLHLRTTGSSASTLLSHCARRAHLG